MAALTTYQRFVIKGTGPGSEIWQTGFSTTCTTQPVDQPALQALLNTIGPFIDTWWTSVKAHCYALYSYTGASAYQYVDPSTSAQFQADRTVTPVPGTLTTSGAPIDTALVVSLRSATPGRSGRGRMYVPFHEPVAFGAGLYAGTTSALIGTATKALFSSITGGSVAAPIVVSRTKHQWYPITELVTDNKPDVQRRRENKLSPSSIQVLAFP